MHAGRVVERVLVEAKQRKAEFLYALLEELDLNDVTVISRRAEEAGPAGRRVTKVGHGQGEEKTFHAIQQALKHPLLESISLEDASGVIANFSGGDDLSLYEVGEAIGHIRTMTGEDVDVVMGVTHDERMQDRAQVILVVTGLGAKARNLSREKEMQGSRGAGTAPTAQEPVPDLIEESREAVPVDILNDLDVPAFMRKRARVAQVNK